MLEGLDAEREGTHDGVREPLRASFTGQPRDGVEKAAVREPACVAGKRPGWHDVPGKEAG